MSLTDITISSEDDDDKDVLIHYLKVVVIKKSVWFYSLYKYIQNLKFSSLVYKSGNSNHSFYYICREKIKTRHLQKLKLDNYILKVVDSTYFERHLSNKYHFKISNLLQISSNFLINDNFSWLHCIYS
jgi:hypothetical protein